MPENTEEQFRPECLRCHSPMEFLGRRSYQTSRTVMPDSFLLYRCPTCGKVEFFEFIVDDIQCLECGALIKAGQNVCPECGWTWENETA